jgi:PPOX class probable F420-dependent enzyme
MSIADEKYIAVQTFKRNGEPVSTACWITDLGAGRVGFWTSSDSFKYKRLKNDPRITVQASDARGRPKAGAAVLSGTAQIVESGADFDAIFAQIPKKYGVMVPISKFMNVIGHLGKGKYRYGDVGVVVTLAS